MTITLKTATLIAMIGVGFAGVSHAVLNIWNLFSFFYLKELVFYGSLFIFFFALHKKQQ